MKHSLVIETIENEEEEMKNEKSAIDEIRDIFVA
jgi:hypothetical protein